MEKASNLRIVSFLPAATEMVCALELNNQLVGVTHECDYPPEVKGKPIVVRNVLPIETMSQEEIDRAVSERMRNGQSLYQIDEQLLFQLAPDLILTQDLCQVCAPSGNEVSQVLGKLPKKPEILWLSPKSLEEIDRNLRDLGTAIGCLDRAEKLISEGQARLERLRTKAAELAYRPRVFCMEWLDPIYASGHWVPEMVEIAGGVDALGRKREDSVRITWDELREWAPNVLIIMPCGFKLEVTIEQAVGVLPLPAPPKSSTADKEKQRSTSISGLLPGWSDLPAVRTGRVYAVDANSYFARPGPRVVEGAELLAHLIHPEVFDWNGPQDAYYQFDFSLIEGRDYYLEGSAMVFTAEFLARRGYCCDSGCRNCPYEPEP
jgi:iron complex transport system substrate-binding protein